MVAKNDRKDREEFPSVEHHTLDKMGIVEWIEAMIQNGMQLDKVRKS